MNDNGIRWAKPTLLERNGQAIAAILGAVVFGLALGMVIVGSIMGALA